MLYIVTLYSLLATITSTMITFLAGMYFDPKRVMKYFSITYFAFCAIGIFFYGIREFSMLVYAYIASLVGLFLSQLYNKAYRHQMDKARKN